MAKDRNFNLQQALADAEVIASDVGSARTDGKLKRKAANATNFMADVESST